MVMWCEEYDRNKNCKDQTDIHMVVRIVNKTLLYYR